jgi:hypothetical protein
MDWGETIMAKENPASLKKRGRVRACRSLAEFIERPQAGANRR